MKKSGCGIFQGIRLEGVRKIKLNLNQNSQSPSQHSNWVPDGYDEHHKMVCISLNVQHILDTATYYTNYKRFMKRKINERIRQDMFTSTC